MLWIYLIVVNIAGNNLKLLIVYVIVIYTLLYCTIVIANRKVNAKLKTKTNSD